MKLNSIERMLINSRARAFVQRWYEAPLLERLGGYVNGKRVLEIGCGRGVGTEIIFERFGAASVHAFDIDARMIEQTRRRLARYSPDHLHLGVGDAAAIKAEDESYDAVFDFMILHHVLDWQRAVSEINRVLRPGGWFFFEEVTSHALNHWSYRAFFSHLTDNRFSAKEFVTEVERQRIVIGENFIERFFGDFIIGVGRRLELKRLERSS